MKRIALTCALLGGLSGMEDDIIVLVRPPASSPAPAPAPVPRPDFIRSEEEAYEYYWNHPMQVWLDSPSGPKPLLGADLIHREDGRVIPRITDPYTWAVIKNPGDWEAVRQYLDWRKVLIRRTALAMDRIPDQAIEMGMITKEMMRKDPGRPMYRSMLADYSHIVPETLGTHLYAPAEARELGIPPERNPIMPARPHESGIEVYWFWSADCAVCHAMSGDWFAFQRAVREAGYRATSIAIGEDHEDMEGMRALWELLHGDKAQYSENWADYWDTYRALGITTVPTVLFVNRQTKEIRRMVGWRTSESERLIEQMRELMAAVGGWEPQWPPPQQRHSTIQTHQGRDGTTIESLAGARDR